MKIRNIFRRETQEVEVGNLVSIKGYPAGEGYYRFVSLVPELAPVTLTDRQGKKRLIRSMICTATVHPGSPLAAKLLEEAANIPTCQDPELLSKKIILVDKKFMKLPNKQQLALLNIEFEKMLGLADGFSGIVDQMPAYEKTSVEQQIGADLATIEIYGRHVFKRATAKAAKLTRKTELKASKDLHKEYVKSIKAEAKAEAEAASKKENASVLESAATDESAPKKKNSLKVKFKKNNKEKENRQYTTLENMTQDVDIDDAEPQGC